MSGEIRVKGRGEKSFTVESGEGRGKSRENRAEALRESAQVPHRFPTGTDRDASELLKPRRADR